jgi:Skp family chaperone for outer membrane proteins
MHAAWLGFAVLASLGQPLAAQTTAASDVPSVVQKTSVVTLDQEKLFSATKYGLALQKQFEAETLALQTENRKIDGELEAEERSLTEKRATMDAASFRPLAEAFDKKANDLRNAQDAKSRDLTKRRDANRQKFFQTIAPILGDYMVERGAVVILDKSAIVVSLGSIDITDEAIARINEKLGDGSTLP